MSSDTSIGCNSEVDITLVPWQAREEDHDGNMPTDISVDPDACQWLPLNPSDGTNLTGIFLFRDALCQCMHVGCVCA